MFICEVMSVKFTNVSICVLLLILCVGMFYILVGIKLKETRVGISDRFDLVGTLAWS